MKRRSMGSRPARRTPAYEALAQQRRDFASLLPDWAASENIHAGVYANRFIDLHAAFSEWVEAREPGAGHGLACTQIFTPQRWVEMFKRTFPRIKTRSNRHRNDALLNRQIFPKNPIPELRYGVCPTCNQTCRIEETTNAPVPASQLADVVQKLDAEAKAALGDQPVRPSSSSLPYSRKT